MNSERAVVERHFVETRQVGRERGQQPQPGDGDGRAEHAAQRGEQHRLHQELAEQAAG